MASALSKSTNTVRNLLIVIVAFVAVVFIVDLFFRIQQNNNDNNQIINPNLTSSPYINADNVFGSIKKANLTSLTLLPGTRAEYAISLPGTFPTFPSVANVYKLAKPQETFGSVSGAQVIAENLGFNKLDYDKVSERELSWENDSGSRTLLYNKVLEDYTYNVNINTDATYAQNIKTLSTKDDTSYQQIGTNLTRSLGITDPYFANAITEVDFININNNLSLERASSIETANFAKLNVFRTIESATLKKNYNFSASETRVSSVLSPIRKYNYLDGTNTMIIQGIGEKPSEDIISMSYTRFDINNKGVYRTITPREAWENIQLNQGYLYYLNPKNSNPYKEYQELKVTRFEVNANEVEIIYLDPEKWEENDERTQYLQPYYLFKGTATLDDGKEADFAFLIEALRIDSYQ